MAKFRIIFHFIFIGTDYILMTNSYCNRITKLNKINIVRSESEKAKNRK